MSSTRIAAFAIAALLTAAAVSGCSDSDKGTVTIPSDQATAITTVPGVKGGYPVVDTGQATCYDDVRATEPPEAGSPFFGQDAQIEGNQATYTDNGDGTVTDEVTGLMWSQTPDLTGDGTIDIDDKLSYKSALASAGNLRLADYDDWRLPTIKELYSLIDFRGIDTSDPMAADSEGMRPFIDTKVFGFGYGDITAGERIIDAQVISSTMYVSTTMNGEQTAFGVNFADGRIKGYPTGPVPGRIEDRVYYVLYVRDNSDYGHNLFVDNGDGTVTDEATGLMWTQADSGEGMDWPDALAWAQARNAEEFLGYDDWRLPNVKELQSIVEYTRAPDVTDSPAIDPVLHTTEITNEGGQVDYPCYWSSTTHVNESPMPGAHAAYLAFGRGLGFMGGEWIDVHGAGTQRSDPKAGDPEQYPTGLGPQGDAIRINNFVRLVRDVTQ